MSFNLPIVSEPKITHSFGSASHWLMSQNPMIWKFQRKDLIIQSITNLGGSGVRFKLTSNPYWINVGDYVYYNNLIGFEKGEYEVIGVDNANATITLICPFPIGPLGWINDTTNLLNYHAYLDIYQWSSSGVAGERIAFAKYYDDPTGLIVADLRKYLDKYFDLSWPSPFGIATRNYGKDQDFSFKRRPGFVHPTIDTSAFLMSDYNTRFWASKGSAQLSDEFGQNWRRYMTYPAPSVANEASLMQFNTMFEEPYYFDGYPFMMSFIYSDKELTNYINRHIQWLDINGNAIDTEKTDQIPFTISEHACVITARGRIQFKNAANQYHQTVDSFYLWLEDSETTVASGGGGGGTGSGTGSGGSNQATVGSDVVESNVVV